MLGENEIEGIYSEDIDEDVGIEWGESLQQRDYQLKTESVQAKPSLVHFDSEHEQYLPQERRSNLCL